jgi:hypothetical protein
MMCLKKWLVKNSSHGRTGVMFQYKLTALLTFACAIANAGPQTVDVFTSGQDGFFAYRIPALQTASDGSLLAFAEGRKNSMSDPGYPKQEISLVMKRSTDGGSTWSAMTIIENPVPFGSAANPAAVLDRNTKRIWLFYIRCKPGRRATKTARPGTDDTQIALRWSDDNGVNWSDRIDITSVSRDMSSTNWNSTVVGPGGAIQDHTGRLIAPAWKTMPWQNLAIFSEDHGKTWQRGGFIPGDEVCDESQVVELADGKILIDDRQGGKGTHRWFSTSSDGGRTWSKRRPGLEAPPVCCAIERWTMKSAGDDKNRIVWTGPKGPGRSNFVARVSYDECQTFGPEHMLYQGSAAYSDLCKLKDGSMGVLFERDKYTLISFVKLTPGSLD